jgi:pimeloyl-ACP methyl ester carboxylesterase
MAKRLSILLMLCMLLALLPVQAVNAQVQPPVENTPPWVPPPYCIITSGASTEAFCLPAITNPSPDLVIFAHGYMRPLVAKGTIPGDQMVIGGVDISTIVNGLGFAFATTSYRRNGLIVIEALDDILTLIADYTATTHLTPPHIYLVGASEGGLITTLSIERHPEKFTGGLALCGPVGDFRQQINYWGDFRAVFDYEFKGQNILPPTAINVPAPFTLSWFSSPPLTILAVAGAIANPANATNLSQLMKITKAPFDPADPEGMLKTTMGLLDYNVNATNNGESVLGGNPFDNRLKWYNGSSNDLALNGKNGVVRYTADATALAALAPYQTKGKLSKPLITMHTTGDEIVPYWHEPLYTAKTIAAGSFFKHINIPISRYGHCNFKASEVLAAFTLLKYKATGSLTVGAEKVLPSGMRADYLQKSQEMQALP